MKYYLNHGGSAFLSLEEILTTVIARIFSPSSQKLNVTCFLLRKQPISLNGLAST
jgi:hypothetical protein